MPVTGKYNFPGIQKAGVAALKVALASTAPVVWLVKWGFGPLVDELERLAINYFANKGLIFLNISAFYIGGEFSQAAFDKALDDGIKMVETDHANLTPEQGKAIDEKVKATFRKLARYTK